MYQRISFIDLLNFYDTSDIFEGVTFPNGLDVETLKETIVDYSAMLEPLYFDYNLFNRKIKTFFNRRNQNYNRMVDVWNAEYNALHNYDKTQVQETSTNDTNVVSQNQSSESSGSSSAVNNGNSESEGLTSAFNTSEYEPNTKTIESEDSTSTTNDTGTSTSISNESAEKNVRSTFTDTTSGNIGVTTSQQMVEAEINLRKGLNVYEIVAKDFLYEFFVRV